MTQHFDLVIKSGTVMAPDGENRMDIGLSNGLVAAMGDLTSATADEIIDATGCHVLPGAIDTQVHFREPGNTHKEDLEAGGKGAVLGGITAFCEMPNTNPTTVTAEALADKVKRATHRSPADFAFFIGADASNLDHLDDLVNNPGCVGVKIFMGSSTGSLLVKDDASVLRALQSGKCRVAVHCEDEDRLIERRATLADDCTVQDHPVWRDEETALRATKRLVKLARQANRRIHVLHVTSAAEIKFLADHKDIATVECTPQHLTLAAPDCYERLGTLAQMNPPIRSTHHRDALWDGLTSGCVDVIGSDHAPHTLEEKGRDYPNTPSGMPGVQTLLPIMLNHVNEGRLTLHRLTELIAVNPAAIYGMKNKGWLREGRDGDVTIVDMNREETILNENMANLSGWTPFDGVRVRGWPVATIVRGFAAMRDGEIIGTPRGEALRF